MVFTAGKAKGVHDCTSPCEYEISEYDTSMYRGSRTIFSYTHMCVREEDAHCIIYGIVEWIILQREENKSEFTFSLHSWRNSDQICPGGNHFLKSKWYNGVNSWSIKDPSRAALATTTVIWRQTLTLCHAVALPTPTCSVTLLKNIASRKMAAMGGVR